MPAQYVKAYIKRNKHDAADAEAICEAVQRPTMRFVLVKTAEQQAAQLLHRGREQLVRQRTMLVNALRAIPVSSGLPESNIVRGGRWCAFQTTRFDGGPPDYAARSILATAGQRHQRTAGQWIAARRPRAWPSPGRPACHSVSGHGWRLWQPIPVRGRPNLSSCARKARKVSKTQRPSGDKSTVRGANTTSGAVTCYVYIAPQWHLALSGLTIEGAIRHERGHCNGWRH